MTREPRVISGPIKEPISVAESTLQTRADYSEDDPLYDIWIAAARDYIEAQCGITEHEKTLEVTLDYWPCHDYIVLPRATPLISVTSLIYYDTAGTPTTMSAADYIVDTDSRPGRIVLAYNTQWPSATLLPANGIRIRYRAGIVTTSPPTESSGTMKYAMLLLVNSFDRNRAAEIAQDRSAAAFIFPMYGAATFIDRMRVESNSF
jgi:uncharacterized phiE125 gp8 family phage protein